MHGRIKLQSAMEYLMTYGWAILVVAVVLGLMFGLGAFSARGVISNSCLTSAGYLCQNPILNSTGWLGMKFGWIGAYPITITNIACTANNAAPASTQAVNVYLQPGSTVTLAVLCPVTSNAIGSAFSGVIWIIYNTPTQTGVEGMVGSVGTTVESAAANVIAAEGGGPSAGGTTSTSTTSSTSSTTSSTSTSTTSATTTVMPPALDTHVTTNQCNCGTTPSFSTTQAGDMIIVIGSLDGASNPSISDTAGLTWTKEYGGTTGVNGACANQYVWYSIPGHTVTNDAVTTSPGSAWTTVFVIAVENVNEFDPNGSLPASSSASPSVTYSTSIANDFIIGLGSSCGGADSISGLTQLDSGQLNYWNDAYNIVSATQSGAAASSGAGGMMVFALGHS